jgi:dihydropteroate synthase
MAEAARRWALPGGGLDLDRTRIMGVVNVTPDSFSDGGRFLRADTAVEQGLKLVEEGADLVDIGGESTRPGSEPISAEEELARVLPVIRGILQRAPGAVVSIDTSKAAVAGKALEAGARVINDITALAGDPDMAGLAADSGAGLVLMHMQGKPRDMQKNPAYRDVVAEVGGFLESRAAAALQAGVRPEAIVVDPGIGFGKRLEHNLALIRGLDELRRLGYPLLLGASRKSFLGLITGRELDQRLFATVGAHAVGALLGADIVRVHEVAPVRDAVLVADAVAGKGG